jgi:hypothetical protein
MFIQLKSSIPIAAKKLKSAPLAFTPGLESQLREKFEKFFYIYLLNSKVNRTSNRNFTNKLKKAHHPHYPICLKKEASR